MAQQKTMILACSGASNVGQLSNQAAVELTREGYGQMFCLAAIGARLEKFVRYARNVPSMVGHRRLLRGVHPRDTGACRGAIAELCRADGAWH